MEELNLSKNTGNNQLELTERALEKSQVRGIEQDYHQNPGIEVVRNRIVRDL